MVFISECVQRSLKQIEWDQVYWPKCEQKVAKLQERIYQASLKDNKYAKQYYQKILTTIPESKLLAVRKITTENRGKKTGGVDKQIITTNEQKIKLTRKLRIDGKAMPIRRIMIPKPGKSEKRPLGIPTIQDRAKQMLLKLALEPEWEAKFEPSSYGFRPGRSCHDAIEHIFTAVRSNGKNRISGLEKWVLDADLRGCYDNINHKYLLKKLNTMPHFQKQIKVWLKAGILEGYLTTNNYDEIITNEKGTPQGGIISPLLANIALNGLEAYLKEWIAEQPDKKLKNRKQKRDALTFVRYADDFVVIHKDKNRLEQIQTEIQNWLNKTSKLTLSDEKTKLLPINRGFSFLGFRIIAVRKNNKPKAKIYPSKKSQVRLIEKLKINFNRLKTAPQHQLIKKLRPLIMGWANYYKYSECISVFNKIDYIIYKLIRKWALRRHQGRKYAMNKYFPGTITIWKNTKYTDKWIFKCKETHKNNQNKELILPKLTWTKSKKFKKIKGTATPFDGNDHYWLNRSQYYGGFTDTQRILLQKQKQKCPVCGTKIMPYTTVQIDHIKGKNIENSNNIKNLQLLHISCHIKKTKSDRTANTQGKR